MPTCEPYRFVICYISLWLWRTVPIIQIFVGTIGNIINIAVLSRRRMRKFSTTVYLIGVAFSDIATLWTATFPVAVFKAFGFPVMNQSTFICRAVWFISYTVSGYSVWLIVLMTVERMILTTSPILARTSLSVRNAVIFAVVALVLCLCLSGHLLVGFEVRVASMTFTYENETLTNNVSLCLPVDGMLPFYMQTWPLIVITVLVVIPFFIIAVGNGAILITLLLQKRRLRKVNPTGNESAVSAYNKRKSSTKTLCLISALFIITTLPYTIDQMVSVYVVSPDPYIQAQKELAYTLTFILITCNFTFNFVLYFVSGSMFKQEWRGLLSDISRNFRKVAGMEVSETRLTTLPDSSVQQTDKSLPRRKSDTRTDSGIAQTSA